MTSIALKCFKKQSHINSKKIVVVQIEASTNHPSTLHSYLINLEVIYNKLKFGCHLVQLKYDVISGGVGPTTPFLKIQFLALLMVFSTNRLFITIF